MLEVQTVAFWINPYAGCTNSCFVMAPLHWRYKHWLYKSTPYAGCTISCFLNASLRWWYNPTLVVQPYAGGTTLRWWYNPTLEVPPYTGGTTLCWWYWHRWPLLILVKFLSTLDQSHHFLTGNVYFTVNILVATDRLELLCHHSKIRSCGMTPFE